LNQDVRAIFLSPGVLPLGPEDYIDADLLNLYLNSLAQTIADAHPNIVAQRSAVKLARDMIDFERKLVRLIPPQEDLVNPNVSERFLVFPILINM
jgi:hypothetical protein